MPAETAAVDFALRGELAHLVGDPFLESPRRAFVHEADGMILVSGGRIVAAGATATMRRRLGRGARVVDYRGFLLCPGFVDAHVHYVQTGIIGARGERLLGWLREYTYPAEQAFADPRHAHREAERFCSELLRNGTTAAMVFCSVHPQSVDALFRAAERRGILAMAGKVLMDRNAPRALRDTAQRGYDETKALLRRWHGRGRARYAITPRFAASCSQAQLEAAGALWREHPDAAVQTHIAESPAEIEWVRRLFPRRRDYLEVYEHCGLVGRGAVLAHGIHLSGSELRRLSHQGAAIAHCPTSNLFLGSGIFRVARAKDPRRPVEVGLGTDVGAGTSFSALQTLNEAYKVSQLAGRALSAREALYLATLGGARALGLGARMGSLQPGYDADVVVLDPRSTPLLAERSRRVESIDELQFLLMTLGDDRAVRATYAAGALAYDRDGSPTKGKPR
jgi:guanine deaminase